MHYALINFWTAQARKTQTRKTQLLQTDARW